MAVSHKTHGTQTASLPSRPQSTTSPAAILAQLDRILRSPPFRSSKRCSLFLRQVVTQFSEGRTDSLRERNLGSLVFGRDPDYNTGQDPIVRSTANEVRKRLAQYYCEPAREQEIRIQLPVGSYVPEIVEPIRRPAVVEVPTPQPSRFRWYYVAAALAVVAVSRFLWSRAGGTALDRFWRPILEHPGPITICMGQPRSYTFTDELRTEMDRWFDAGAPDGVPETLANLSVTDVIPTWDWFISLGDAETMTRLTALFGSHGKATALRGGRRASLRDLRGKPTVLVGAFNNDWTLNLTGQLRFSFQEEPDTRTEYVRDALEPQRRNWSVHYGEDEPSTVDYAIVSRVTNILTEQTIVVAAGISGPATRSAGEFLTSETYFQQALADAPPDWDRKNIQIVLSTEVVDQSPGPPKVIATHFW